MGVQFFIFNIVSKAFNVLNKIGKSICNIYGAMCNNFKCNDYLKYFHYSHFIFISKRK